MIPEVKPVTVHEVVVAVQVNEVCPEALAVTVYELMVNPAYAAGAVQVWVDETVVTT